MSEFTEDTSQTDKEFNVQLAEGQIIEIFINGNPVPAFSRIIRIGNVGRGVLRYRLGDAGKVTW